MRPVSLPLFLLGATSAAASPGFFSVRRSLKEAINGHDDAKGLDPSSWKEFSCDIDLKVRSGNIDIRVSSSDFGMKEELKPLPLPAVKPQLLHRQSLVKVSDGISGRGVRGLAGKIKTKTNQALRITMGDFSRSFISTTNVINRKVMGKASEGTVDLGTSMRKTFDNVIIRGVAHRNGFSEASMFSNDLASSAEAMRCEIEKVRREMKEIREEMRAF